MAQKKTVLFISRNDATIKEVVEIMKRRGPHGRRAILFHARFLDRQEDELRESLRKDMTKRHDDDD